VGRSDVAAVFLKLSIRLSVMHPKLRFLDGSWKAKVSTNEVYHAGVVEKSSVGDIVEGRTVQD
jgi:hypothetical protein